jgi:3-oxo-5-alpha-steroid 4-dehydrogenase 1
VFESIYSISLAVLFITSPIVLVLLLVVTAPYGRHNRKGFGLTLQSRLAWCLMELPAFLTILVVYLAFCRPLFGWPLVYLLIWETHYLYRTFIYSSLIRGSGKTFPALLVFFAFVFNILNGYVNGFSLFFQPAGNLPADFLTPHFLIGLAVFVTGFAINIHSDRIIRNLRQKGETGYKIPYGGLFRFVSSPNYMGEIIEWIGWAILTWSFAGFSFAVFTFCNLAPRAVSNHNWYCKTFTYYPKERKILFPFVF